MGHGWTCEAIGIEEKGWDKQAIPVSDEQKELMALVHGKRDLFQGVALLTELCYSTPRVFNAVVDQVVEYALGHPEVDVLHFWLSDGANNHCECQKCQKTSPSDWYARLVNAVLKRLANWS